MCVLQYTLCAAVVHVSSAPETQLMNIFTPCLLDTITVAAVSLSSVMESTFTHVLYLTLK